MEPIQDDIGDPVLARLEEGRAALGGFGEPVWSQAMMQYRMLVAERDREREAYRGAREMFAAKYAALEAERDRLIQALEQHHRHFIVEDVCPVCAEALTKTSEEQ
jgi:uncharacterized protein with PIN domain